MNINESNLRRADLQQELTSLRRQRADAMREMRERGGDVELADIIAIIDQLMAGVTSELNMAAPAAALREPSGSSTRDVGHHTR